jgi:hypothetical protein
MKSKVKTWLIVINECPYHQKSNKATAAISVALLQFRLDHPKDPMSEFSICCHELSTEEEERCRSFPKRAEKEGAR